MIKISVKSLGIGTIRKIEKTTVYLLFSLFIQLVFSNRNHISLSSSKVYDKLITMTGKKLGCPCSLVSYSHFSTDRAQDQGKSAMFLTYVCTESALNDAIKLCAERMRSANVRNGLNISWAISLLAGHEFKKVNLSIYFTYWLCVSCILIYIIQCNLSH